MVSRRFNTERPNPFHAHEQTRLRTDVRVYPLSQSWAPSCYACPSLRYDRGAQTLSATQGQCTAGPRAPSRRHAPVRRTCSAISRRKRRARPRNSASWRRSAASAYGRIYRTAIVPRSRALVRPTSRMTCRLWHCTRCAHCTHCTRCTLRIGALLIRWKLSLPLHSHNFLPNSKPCNAGAG